MQHSCRGTGGTAANIGGPEAEAIAMTPTCETVSMTPEPATTTPALVGDVASAPRAKQLPARPRDERVVSAATLAPAAPQQGWVRPNARNRQSQHVKEPVQAPVAGRQVDKRKPQPQPGVVLQRPDLTQKEDKEAPPLAAHEFPSLSTAAAKARKGPPSKRGTLPNTVQAQTTITRGPVDMVAAKNAPVEGTAWGKGAEEARKAAAAKR